MNPTARLTRSQPEIQNLPGTPAHALEMGFARYGMNDDRAYRELWNLMHAQKRPSNWCR